MPTHPAQRRTAEDRRYHVPNLERALAILEDLDQYPDGASMTEIGLRLGFPKNSVFRIVMTLFKHGYLERRSVDKQFVLSRKVLALGFGGVVRHGFLECARDAMRQLRDLVKETVCLSILLEDEGFVLEQAPGLHPFRFVADPGTRQPLHASASSKAILAFLPPEQCKPILRRMKMRRLTDRTIVDKDEFRRHLERIRQQGYALDWGEHLEGVVCVAAPVFDHHNQAAAAITVTAPASRVPEESLAGWGLQVRAHADMISQRLGAAIVAPRPYEQPPA